MADDGLVERRRDRIIAIPPLFGRSYPVASSCRRTIQIFASANSV
jgi:hypothetical protein